VPQEVLERLLEVPTPAVPADPGVRLALVLPSNARLGSHDARAWVTAA
jgi:hypothetical protein